MLKIGGITEISTIDYPGKVVSVLYLCGCNFRCPFCHNFELVQENNCIKVSEESIAENILQNYPIVSGVCITGGEPTLQSSGLEKICRKLKKEGMLVKLDTNGYYPERIEKLSSLIDYVAMDIKTVFDEERYFKATMTKNCTSRILKSIEVLQDNGVVLEARTTIVPKIIYDKVEIIEIAKTLNKYGVKHYTLQQFRGERGTLDKSFSKLPSPTREYLIELAMEAKKYIPNVLIRTEEGGEEKV